MCAQRHDSPARFAARKGNESGRKHLATENLDTFLPHVGFKLNVIIRMPGLLSTARDWQTATWNVFIGVTPDVVPSVFDEMVYHTRYQG